MTNKKEYHNFAVYGSKDGKRALNVKYFEHFRMKEGSQEETSMGWKVWIETTNDGWQKDWDKKIIMLEGNELVEIIALLQWHISYMKAMRNNPVKHFELKTQGNDYFVSLKSSNTVHGFKMNKYDWLRLMSFAAKALEKDFDTSYSIYIQWIEYVNSLYNKSNQEETVKQVQLKTEDSPIEIEEISNISTKNNDNWYTCSCCWKELDLVSEKKVIDFSMKKYWKVICYQCQKKI